MVTELEMVDEAGMVLRGVLARYVVKPGRHNPTRDRGAVAWLVTTYIEERHRPVKLGADLMDLGR